MTTELPTDLGPWVLSGVLLLGVITLSLILQAILPAPTTRTIGVVLLVLGVIVAGGTGIALLMRGHWNSREFAFTIFLVTFFLGILLS